MIKGAECLGCGWFTMTIRLQLQGVFQWLRDCSEKLCPVWRVTSLDMDKLYVDGINSLQCYLCNLQTVCLISMTHIWDSEIVLRKLKIVNSWFLWNLHRYCSSCHDCLLVAPYQVSSKASTVHWVSVGLAAHTVMEPACTAVHCSTCSTCCNCSSITAVKTVALLLGKMLEGSNWE